MPIDGFGRAVDYLRISLIDHCNLRCVYCMPLRGLTFAPSEELLTADGKFHLCLLNDDELDVKAVLRNGGGKEAVARILHKAVTEKPTRRQLEQGVSTEKRSMFQLGG